jgi:hypothetical protein
MSADLLCGPTESNVQTKFQREKNPHVLEPRHSNEPAPRSNISART